MVVEGCARVRKSPTRRRIHPCEIFQKTRSVSSEMPTNNVCILPFTAAQSRRFLATNNASNTEDNTSAAGCCLKPRSKSSRRKGSWSSSGCFCSSTAWTKGSWSLGELRGLSRFRGLSPDSSEEEGEAAAGGESGGNNLSWEMKGKSVKSCY